MHEAIILAHLPGTLALLRKKMTAIVSPGKMAVFSIFTLRSRTGSPIQAQEPQGELNRQCTSHSLSGLVKGVKISAIKSKHLFRDSIFKYAGARPLISAYCAQRLHGYIAKSPACSPNLQATLASMQLRPVPGAVVERKR